MEFFYLTSGVSGEGEVLPLPIPLFFFFLWQISLRNSLIAHRNATEFCLLSLKFTLIFSTKIIVFLVLFAYLDFFFLFCIFSLWGAIPSCDQSLLLTLHLRITSSGAIASYGSLGIKPGLTLLLLLWNNSSYFSSGLLIDVSITLMSFGVLRTWMLNILNMLVT